MSVAVGARNPDAPRRALLRRLRLLQARLWIERLVRDVGRGICLGLALGLGGALALVAQSGLVERDTLALVVLGGGLGGLTWALLRPPSLLRTARTADLRFGLEARLGTAVEQLRESDSRRGRFRETQLDDAVAALRAARGGWPLPLAVARREAALAALLGLALLATLQFEGQGPSLLVGPPSGPGEAAPAAGERQALADPSQPTAGVAGTAGTPPAGQAGAVLRTLDELRRARESGALSPDQANGALDRVESELGQRSAEAQARREPLDRLGRALAQGSASESAAESIQRGDYAQAGSELGRLGQESDQLSPEAKSQLSQALRRAAAESPTNPALADRERRAADALAGKDYQAAQAAMAALGDEVSRSGSQAGSQADLGEALQRLQDERSASAQGGAAGDRVAAPGAQSGSAGQSGGSQAGLGEGAGRGGGGGALTDPGGPGQNGRQPLPDGPAEKNGPAAVGAAAPRLDVAGQQVEVPARPGSSEPGPQTDRVAPDEQVVDQTQSSFDIDKPAEPVQAGGQAERIIVPGDQRQVVRDYFANRGGKGSP